MNPIELADALQRQFELTEYGRQPAELYDPIRYIMSLGGKRLRPLMTLMTTALFTDNWQLALKPAVAVEVFHNFTLLHDDIMDKAPLRRGQPTVHEKWNANIAILSGDVMLVRAFEQLLDVQPAQLRTVLKRFSQTAAEVCEGQQMDMNFETRDVLTNAVSEVEYIEMIRLKTSVLLGFAMELGGLIAGADTDSTHHLYEAGVNIGIGFQLKDDLLDVYGDPAKFGKQVGGDIIANKKTFMLIEALERAEGDTRTQLLGWLACDTFDKAEKVAAVTQIYDQLGIRQLAEQRVAEYVNKGFANLEQVEADPDRKAILLDFAHQLVERES
ncbi:Dimethylallyltranstransferase [Fibrella aestuarina BUZ 2]|uniref:Dimethylallyltranstransferase n=1 Tax=Fibrella aestuarina BUZ 2 TaxID=1166018 RepID=I0K7V1_9BACT|nr:polyprenyl synthetase family protein [Fibrella aestuarina]CCH00204.1 Dimethylallyltranstransferase [Fibrella aestuarina BUZ 2]